MKKKIKSCFAFCFYVFVFFVIFSCKTTDIKGDFYSEEELSFVTKIVDKQKNYFLAEINLSNPNLNIKTYPKQKDYFSAMSVKKFAKENDCFMAINANPFKVKSKLNPMFSKRRAIGLYIDDYVQYSSADEHYSFIAFFKEENGFSAKIYDSQKDFLRMKEEESKNIFAAFGGFWTILRDEKIYNFKDIKDFRSAVGLSKDGKTLYVFCGKKLSYMQTAQILKKNGVYCAMQLDGGSPSELYYLKKTWQALKIKQMPAVILGFSYIENF